MSFAPYGRDANPDKGEPTTEAQIRADVEAVAPYTRAVRTYASTGNLDLVARLAGEKGLKTTVGAWLDEDEARNEREITNAIDVARKNSNVVGIVVGNESILRAERTPEQLIETIRRVKRETNVPVTTGETWDVWLDHPELVSAVDYIAAHMLPYWEGVSPEQVVDHTIAIYDRLRATYPGKRIVIAEFGWPSQGYNRDSAVPGELTQAQIIRTFAARADALGIEYNLIEAFDAPWKSFEGSVGQYWGILDADRVAKFPLSGPITPSTYTATAAIALLLGIAFSLPVFRFARLTLTQALVMVGAANLVGAWIATVTDHWLTHYVVGGNMVTMVICLVLLVPLVVVMLYRVEELATIAFGRTPRRLLRRDNVTTPSRTPKVSIHIPAYKEPPEMLKQTLDSVARLNWPNFECLVIINNTPDPAFWEPIEAHCRALGDRFKFINLPKVAGFKAGALRAAMLQTAPDAEIIGIIDADYVVDSNWLMDLVPTFEDPTVGIVQAPQDHRDADRSLLHEAMNTEYAGFFDIGMVQRNEHDAIVVHGTMCLMRRAAMVEAGDWSSDTICEDTDLGLAIVERGWKSHYTSTRYGWGLLPDDFASFKKQRHRWAYGGMQIIKKHWRRMLPNAGTRLTTAQRREFSIGWVSWLGSESVGALVAILSLLWVPFVLGLGIAVPQRILTIPIVFCFGIYLLHFIALYRLRVATTPVRMLGAAFAAMAVQFTVAKAVYDSFRYKDLAFARTAKGSWLADAARAFPALPEAIIGAGLMLSAVALRLTNWHAVVEVDLFALALAIQSLPFLAAAGIGWLEGSTLNAFSTWRALRGRALALLPGRTAQPQAVPEKIG
ncbi:glycosyltransferase [Ancylobacter vacuolatus]|uniref:Exo-beta-1,3-glucanase (GH17 family)/cellulose synthase/poly-beta-1,6-N-acetylglucosamine synthase-like glycosyltransferase n=1 Tax=Ancylobacter vacuolatus TaxID=223389 RepID=A0ABU0DBI3_9HYPH|nr:glycosyltransferase [Ancylobacter vacuolatus]MDQ0345784.1 exo-beta-1,3-glucanase (GH17 family)/cellulose synthase/poly-beta-1,6-N-acetylglucosamine synthase-like glycosyltransferase [Ancylobacter vacuolatus]